jgi:aryl-alcohol dehydrogenase-like predicted oxidoreductase
MGITAGHVPNADSAGAISAFSGGDAWLSPRCRKHGLRRAFLYDAIWAGTFLANQTACMPPFSALFAVSGPEARIFAAVQTIWTSRNGPRATYEFRTGSLAPRLQLPRSECKRQLFPKREAIMNTRQLGNSDLYITPIGFGAWAIGGSGWEHAWGAQDDHDSVAAIQEALDSGINWIDTAAVYGLGHSEEVVARALEGMGNRPYIFTKCSQIWDEKRKISHSLKAESIRRECEASLRRLKVDAIDLYQVHWPMPDEEIEEGWAAMVKLKEEGKVRNIGVSNFDVSQMQRALAIAPITSLQPPYSLIHREVEGEILPFAEQENIGVIAYSPMASGLLTGAMTKERIKQLPDDDWRQSHPDFQEPLLSRNLRLVRLLRAIGNHHGRMPGEVAVAWVLDNPAVTGAIVGARRPGQIKGIVGAAGFRLSPSELAEFDAFFAKPAAVDAVPKGGRLRQLQRSA